MPRDDGELKPRYQFKPKKPEPAVSGIKKALEARREIGSKKVTPVSAGAEPPKVDKKPQSFIDALTHIPEQILDAEEKMRQQVQTQIQVQQMAGTDKKLEEANKKSDDYLERLKYLQAEFDNYRKRTEREKLESAKYAGEGITKDLLPFLDEFEIAVSSVKDEKLKAGFEMLYRNFLKILHGRGLERIDSLGKKLDPYLHEVVMMQPSDKEEGTIIMEVQKGYRINGKVLRAAKVVVSSGNQPGAEKKANGGETVE